MSVSDIPEVRKAMIMTIGVGADSEPDSLPGSLALALAKVRPDHVIGLYSDQSASVFIRAKELLAEREDWQGLGVHWIGQPISQVDDIDALFPIFKRCIEALLELGYEEQQIVAKFTSGTKAMSAGLSVLASQYGLRLLYLAGDQKVDGRTQSGFERLVFSSPYQYSVHENLRLAHTLIMDMQFSAARRVANRYYDSRGNNRLDEQTEATRRSLFQLATGYHAWDRFDHSEAIRALGSGVEHSRQILNIIPAPGDLAHLQTLVNERDTTDVLSVARLAELLANADRRMFEGEWEDAIGRLYRATEMLAQIALFRGYDVLTDKVPVDLASRERRPDADDRSPTKEIGLKAAYDLLDSKGHRLGRSFKTSRIQNLLQQRNQSILAHGFDRVTETMGKNFRSAALDLIRSEVADIDERVQAIQFPWLRDHDLYKPQ